MYEGNYLLSNEAIRGKLSQYVPLGALTDLESRLKCELSKSVSSVYKGYLGVDMMICRFPESPAYRIHPCVEINLRMNMGVVARHLYDRYICPFSTGIFQIDYAPSDGAAWNAHTAMAETYPLEMEQGRICSGYLPLVPVYKKSKYRAWILVSESVHCVI